MKVSVKQLTPDEWWIYRDMRLAALKEHPDFFDPTSDETQFSETDWKKRLANIHGATFGLYDENRLIGLTTIFRKNNDPLESVALFVSSYIQKPYRGQGLSRFLYESRIEWAKNQTGIKKIVLEHREDNIASQKAHEKFGFKLVHSYMYRWPDGQNKICLVYELDLP